MALLLAVTVMSLLVAVTMEFNKNMRYELVSSTTVRENSKLGAIIRSGYNLAEAVLLQDAKDNKFDSEHDRWAKIAGSNLSKLFSRGSLYVSISDFTGKLQLNSFTSVTVTPPDTTVGENGRLYLKRLLETGEFGDLSTEEMSLVVEAINDWVDTDDDQKGFEETESGYYQSLDPSYSCKNGPFEHIEELLLVRGITKDLYYGTGEYKGLRDFVTVHGVEGKINLNSALPEILMAMNVDMTEELVNKLVAFREDESNKDLLQNIAWYVDILPADIKFENNMLTAISNFFGITAEAEFNEVKRTLHAVVQRTSGNKISLVTRKVE